MMICHGITRGSHEKLKFNSKQGILPNQPVEGDEMVVKYGALGSEKLCDGMKFSWITVCM